jgi:hypothetical protein
MHAVAPTVYAIIPKRQVIYTCCLAPPDGTGYTECLSTRKMHCLGGALLCGGLKRLLFEQAGSNICQGINQSTQG